MLIYGWVYLFECSDKVVPDDYVVCVAGLSFSVSEFEITASSTFSLSSSNNKCLRSGTVCCRETMLVSQL